MESKEKPRSLKSQKEPVMEAKSAHHFQPLLLPSAKNAYIPQRSTSKHFPAQRRSYAVLVTEESEYEKLDTYQRFGVSIWNYVPAGPAQADLVRWFRPWETGPRTAADEEFSWTTGQLLFPLATRQIQKTGACIPSKPTIQQPRVKRSSSCPLKHSARTRPKFRQRHTSDPLPPTHLTLRIYSQPQRGI